MKKENPIALVIRQGEWFDRNFYEKPGGEIFKFEFVSKETCIAFFAAKDFIKSDPTFGNWFLKNIEVFNAQKTRAQNERNLN